MMSSLFSVFVILLLFNCSVVLTEDASVTQLKDYFYKKCYERTQSTKAFDKLYTDVYEFFEYYQYAVGFLNLEKKTTFCKNERDNLLLRIKEIKKDLKPCLHPNEHYLADFFDDSFTESLHFLCHNNGQYATILFSKQASDCQDKILQSGSKDLDYCLNRIFPPTKSFLVKKDLCDDITVGQKCIDQLLESQCKSATQLREINEKFFRYISKPCAACRLLSAGYVLGFAIIMHLFAKFNFM